jgi:UDP-galactopyranose mutase
VSFEQIPLSIINRIPKTTNCEDPSWFEGETYQCLPKNGYTKMMENMLDGISVGINCKDWEWKKYTADLIIYTGRIDEFYSYKFGTLPYRSLEFTHRFTSNKLSTAVINQNMIEVPYTRKYDHSYFNYQHKGYTIITEEYSTECKENNIPFYPIPFGDGQKRYAQYKKLANNEQSTIFLGRLATYRYLDMWMAVKQAMLKAY